METRPARPLAHRPVDALRAVTALALLVVTSIAALRGELNLDAWQTFVGELPVWITQGCAAMVVVALSVALLVSIASFLRLRSDSSFARDVAVSWVAVLATSWVVAALVVNGGVDAGTLDPARSTLLTYPDLALAVIASITVVSSAHVARPNRRLLWWLLLASSSCATLTDPLALLPVVGGVALGLAIGSGWLWGVGSPAGFPEAVAVRASLARYGIAVDDVRVLSAQSWGGAVVCMATRVGTKEMLRVKVFGRDAVTGDFWMRLYRRFTYLDAQRSWTGKGIDSVEHEAAVTTLAEQRGVLVTRVVAVSDWAEADPFLAVQWPGLGMDELTVEAITDDALARVWACVGSLHDAQIIHGGLDGASIRVVGDAVFIGNLERSRFSADKRLRDRDLANLLVVIGSLIGAKRAVRSAVQALGLEEVNDLVSYLEPAAIRVPLAQGRDVVKPLLAAIKAEITDRTGMSPPPPAVLKRLTARRLLAMGLVVLAVTALFSALSGIDFAAVAKEVADAEWLLVLLALVIGQLILIPEALATTSLVPERLPFGPLVALQSAMRFLGLAVPGPAARVAANVAFLRKQGIVAARSLTLGVLDSATGLLVELMILVVAVLVGDLSLALFGIEPLDLDWTLITALLLAALLVCVLLLRFVTPIRDRATATWRSVQDALDVLRDSPSRALALFATNFAARCISACALWLVLVALGVDLDIIAVLVVIAASNLLSGLIPVPGNVGVAEAALTAFLVAAGVDEDTAFAAAVVYRVITAYIPPVWGAAAQRWLARNDYL